jgi:O-antigen ligase
MPIARTNPRRKASAAQMLLLGLAALCGTVDLLHNLPFGSLSGMGVATLLACGGAWAMWLARPALPTDLLKPLLPLLMFDLYACGSMLWYNPGPKGLQLLAVALAFLALILLTARETDRNPEMAHRLQKTLLYSSAVGVLLYFFAVAKGGLDATGGIVGGRTFALYAMVIVSIAIARWRGGQKSALIWTIIVLLAVFLSLSRTALVASLLLFPLAFALRGDRKSIMLAVLILALGGISFGAAVMSYKPLYDRFFGYDASMSVGGLNVNASGRTAMWNGLLENLGNDWVFGKGIAASGNYIDDYFPELGHPHNDYLRFYYDLGVVGLAMWLAFVGMIIVRISASLRRAILNRSSDYPLHLAALLALAAVSISMLTDNSVDYFFVMIPLGIVIGCSLGVGRVAKSQPAANSFNAVATRPIGSSQSPGRA